MANRDMPSMGAKEALSLQRAQAILNSLGLLLALARDQEMNHEALISWIHRHYEERGFYAERASEDPELALKEVIQDFRRGRELLYGECEVGEGEVRTILPYWDVIPEGFFYFDIRPEDFFAYSKRLAERYAARLGIQVDMHLEGRTEVARFRVGTSDKFERGLSIADKQPEDEEWLQERYDADWGGSFMVLDGKGHDLTSRPTLVAWEGAERVGYLVYEEQVPGEAEILALQAVVPGTGTGTALVEALSKRVSRMRVVTTNDNLTALRFYQRRGFRITEVRRDAVSRSRKHKPSIPTVGAFGIPIIDEIVLERPEWQ